MKNIAISAFLISVSTCFYTQCAASQAVPAAPAAEAATAAPLTGVRLAGQGVLRFLGFEIYRARLWVAPGFDVANYGAQPLALELTYHRDFTAQAIAKRSLEEMRRVGSFTPEQAARWQQALQAALPDGEFSRLFFGIWLSPQTSEPGLRQELLAATRNAGQP